jgi:hypothetical protein
MCFAKLYSIENGDYIPIPRVPDRLIGSAAYY